jgi:hypothetical protein
MFHTPKKLFLVLILAFATTAGCGAAPGILGGSGIRPTYKPDENPTLPSPVADSAKPAPAQQPGGSRR